MYFVYILENSEGKHYVGYTANLQQRVKDHNSTKTRWTKRKGLWQLVYTEAFDTKEEAYSTEKEIKRYKSGRAFRELLSKGLHS